MPCKYCGNWVDFSRVDDWNRSVEGGCELASDESGWWEYFHLSKDYCEEARKRKEQKEREKRIYCSSYNCENAGKTLCSLQ